MSARDDLSAFLGDRKFGTVLADPPWRFANRTGKIAPEHWRLARYGTLSIEEICALPVAEHLDRTAHCYLWVPNALLPYGLRVLARLIRGTARLSPDFEPAGARVRRLCGAGV